jgi:hypothetical protein
LGSPDILKVEPNPVVVQLRPAGPPPRQVIRAKPKKPKPPKAAAPAAGGSPFPDPSAPPPPGQTR